MYIDAVELVAYGGLVHFIDGFPLPPCPADSLLEMRTHLGLIPANALIEFVDDDSFVGSSHRILWLGCVYDLRAEQHR